MLLLYPSLMVAIPKPTQQQGKVELRWMGWPSWTLFEPRYLTKHQQLTSLLPHKSPSFLPLNSCMKSLRPVLGELIQFIPKLRRSPEDVLSNVDLT